MQYKQPYILITALLLLGLSLQAQTTFYTERAAMKDPKKESFRYARPGLSPKNPAQLRTPFFSAAARRLESRAASF